MLLLDSNVFIEAKNRYYAFDICPGFWSWMDSVCGNGIGSIRNVRDELSAGQDDLAAWAKDRHDASWFMKVDDSDTQNAYAEIAGKLSEGHYTPQAMSKFLGDADSWLIAKAKALGATVVTHELPNPASKKRVLMPDVCNWFDVPFQNTFEALRAHSAKFYLGAPGEDGAGGALNGAQNASLW